MALIRTRTRTIWIVQMKSRWSADLARIANSMDIQYLQAVLKGSLPTEGKTREDKLDYDIQAVFDEAIRALYAILKETSSTVKILTLYWSLDVIQTSSNTRNSSITTFFLTNFISSVVPEHDDDPSSLTLDASEYLYTSMKTGIL